MSEYYPDKWIIIKIDNHSLNNSFYRVFGMWYGGYTSGDSWRMNSGITQIVDHENLYEFKGESGSSYFCHKNSYGTSLYGQEILDSIIKNVPSDCEIIILSRDTNFMELDYT